MMGVFYSIRFSAKCTMLKHRQDGGDSHLYLRDGLRPGFFFEDEYYPCKIFLKGEIIEPGENGVLEVHAIPVVPLGIKPGDKFELRAADRIIANCEVIKLLENEKKEY